MLFLLKQQHGLFVLTFGGKLGSDRLEPLGCQSCKFKSSVFELKLRRREHKLQNFHTKNVVFEAWEQATYYSWRWLSHCDHSWWMTDQWWRSVSWKIFFQKALWTTWVEKPHTLIRKKKLILGNIEKANFSTGCTSEKCLPEGRIRTEYITTLRPPSTVKKTADWKTTSVQFPTHVCFHVLFRNWLQTPADPASAPTRQLVKIANHHMIN